MRWVGVFDSSVGTLPPFPGVYVEEAESPVAPEWDVGLSGSREGRRGKGERFPHSFLREGEEG